MGKKRTRTSAKRDDTLRDALRAAYTSRSKMFLSAVLGEQIEHLIMHVEAVDMLPDEWSLDELGITQKAFEIVEQKSAVHFVFAHPAIISALPTGIVYYRTLAALSNKGYGQILEGLNRNERSREAIRLINSILSELVEQMESAFTLNRLRALMPLELGTELQGSWVNMIGTGAAKAVKLLIGEYVRKHKLAAEIDTHGVHITLTNGWTITFGSEPDVSIRNSRGTLKAAIEIKGSTDKAGAQTRYGEAKKSFAKALAEQGQCETIYLASCFTEAVVEQIRRDAQVRKTFNLTEVLADDEKQVEFLEELFRHIIRIEH